MSSKRDVDPSKNKLYREGEVPEELKGRGIWGRYGNEYLFCPFMGNFNYKEYQICKYCGFEYSVVLFKINKNRCPKCKRWDK